MSSRRRQTCAWNKEANAEYENGIQEELEGRRRLWYTSKHLSDRALIKPFQKTLKSIKKKWGIAHKHKARITTVHISQPDFFCWLVLIHVWPACSKEDTLSISLPGFSLFLLKPGTNPVGTESGVGRTKMVISTIVRGGIWKMSRERCT